MYLLITIEMIQKPYIGGWCYPTHSQGPHSSTVLCPNSDKTKVTILWLEDNLNLIMLEEQMPSMLDVICRLAPSARHVVSHSHRSVSPSFSVIPRPSTTILSAQNTALSFANIY